MNVLKQKGGQTIAILFESVPIEQLSSLVTHSTVSCGLLVLGTDLKHLSSTQVWLGITVLVAAKGFTLLVCMCLYVCVCVCAHTRACENKILLETYLLYYL